MIRIGITLPPDEGQSVDQLLWSSGMTQNIIFLTEALKHAGYQVFALGSHRIANILGLEAMLGGPGYINVGIELGSTLNRVQAEHFRRGGRKLISHPVGNTMFLNMEAATGHGQTPFIPQNEYDAVWILPQFWKSNAVAAELMCKCPVHCAPIVWRPQFVTQFYTPTPEKRVAIFEPSLSVVKTPIIPLMIADQCNKMVPDRIKYVHMYAAQGNKVLMELTSKLAIQDRTMLHLRQKSQEVLEGVSAVVSHTIENGFNYNWYELLAGGFPLLHNSEQMPAGYRYPSFDIEYGAALLNKVLEEHDDPKIFKQYNETAQAFLEKVTPIAAAPMYRQLIEKVIA